MKLRRIMAATTASALAVGGLMIGGATAAFAAVADEYVPLSAITPTTDAASEAAAYNEWHFDPDHAAGVSQAPNGLIVSASGDALVMLGNGNDIVKSDPAAQPDNTTIEDLAANLWVVASDASKVSFQIPVFYNVTNGLKYTTLRKNAADSASTQWVSSANIVDPADPATIVIAKDAPAELADIVAALDAFDNDARAIGAGFLVQNPGSDVLVSSFSSTRAADYVTTSFYEPGAVDPVNTSPLGEFVHSDDINADETTYPGWHQGSSGADLGTYASVVSGAAVNGLLVTGKSQILNGFAPENFLDNNLLDVLNAGVSIHGAPSDDAVGYTFQIPLFFYTEGVIGQQFTTVRADVPADGVITADLQWTASRAIGVIPAGAVATLDALLGAMSSYQALGYGFYIESGSVTAQSITFNGLTTSFVKTAPVTPSPETPKGPQKIANTGAGDITPMIGIAALALLALGGVTLAASRARQS